jgi:hypothetical protein
MILQKHERTDDEKWRRNNTKVAFKVKTADGKEISDPNQVFREMEKEPKRLFRKITIR